MEIENEIIEVNKNSHYFKKLKEIKDIEEYSIVINAQNIFKFDSKLYKYLIKYPAETI